ncbi:MAG TPA: quinone oxidoreductase [Actinomycetota bacterium]|nr:quinone oxidoreductase [Actinomycetota bacterium]
MKAIRVREQGPPEVLVEEEVDDPHAGSGEVLVGLHAAGVNMIDVQQRSGGYPVPVPFIPGTEGAGEVVEIGADVEAWSAGDRVAFAGAPGAYAELAVVPAERLVPVPAEIPTDIAAAVLLQGMTAHYLLHSLVPLGEGEVVVVQSAAGGVGLLLTQMATAAGVHVIGTTSTDEKAAFVLDVGAVEAVVRGRDDLAAVVAERTNGAGARVVFDSVGRDTFDASLGVLARRGCLALFGQSSGAVPPVDVSRLQKAGSVFLTRPGLADYVATRKELLHRADAVFSSVASGRLDVRIHARYPLARADEAHRAVQSRTTAGKLILVTDRGAGR